MLVALFAVIFWTIMFFIACAVSPIVFFFMIIWTIYQYFKLLCLGSTLSSNKGIYILYIGTLY